MRAAAVPPSSIRKADAETNDFEPGDIWYFPRGHGHSIQCLGHKPCHFVLVFDNGYFSEFGTFSVTDWIGHTPHHLLAKNLGLPAEALDKFPKQEVYFVRGPVPPEQMQPEHRQGAESAAQYAQVSYVGRESALDTQRRKGMARGPGSFPISKTVTGVILDLNPGGIRANCTGTPTPNEWQYVISGPGPRHDVRLARPLS